MLRPVLAAGLSLLMLMPCACSDPVAPDKERPPEPQARARAVDSSLERTREVRVAVERVPAARTRAAGFDGA